MSDLTQLDVPAEPTPSTIDIQASDALGTQASNARDTPGPGAVNTAKGETSELELSRAQHTFARRVAESKATIPHLTLQVQADMQACVALRPTLAGVSPEDSSTESATGYGEMVVRACALALREHPRANSSYRDGRVQLHSRVNIGLAIALDSGEPDGSTVVVPTVFDADTRGLGEIAREIRDLRARAREGSLAPPELSGATFTVFDLGPFGVDAFAATVFPGQAAILAVGSVHPRAVADDNGQVVVRETVTLSLSCDNRVLYGADAGALLDRIRELLRSPTAL
jgi:pyruvate dehydrogenase E2 component (dihydrolipoamide acetyltransferase)